MSNQLHKICDLINNKESLEDEKKFKLASATLVCDVVHNVIDTDEKKQQKYCGLFQDRLNLPVEELEKIKDSIDISRETVDEKIEYIKKSLNNSSYEIMEFLKILNRFIVLDGCNKESYREFEIIRDKFLEDFY
ncbi:hypothetical protein MNB_SV-12-773 [hydrothermal vent metagenome]|uniref:Uncharacterized protein n=1 Tax=hydrothermal vent metagenome TaxID=652676 RepID=A0A1W1BD98_9ZZZZ